MARNVSGRVIDEDGEGLFEYRVTLGFPGSLFGKGLKSGLTKAHGMFDLNGVRRGGFRSLENNVIVRKLELVVQDTAGRVVGRFPVTDDYEAEHRFIGDFKVHRKEAEGFTATLGTGSPSRFSEGNAVTFLMDEDAFARAAELMFEAEEELLLSQLFFPVPPKFDADLAKEETKLVFQFGAPALETANLRKVDGRDMRPEWLLSFAADRGAQVKILIHGFDIPLWVKIVASVLVIPVAVSAIKGTNILFEDDFTDADEVKKYFAAANRPRVKALPFEQPVLSAGVMHAKLVVVDGVSALSIGSPFGQGYIDGHQHRIDNPARGGHEGFPMHDAGFDVSGPAVGDLHESLRLLWNIEATGADRVNSRRPPPSRTQGGEAVCDMEVVRTLSKGGKFEGLTVDGEQGILEAYQRAINMAAEYIYLETQYFTNDAIGDALVNVLKHSIERGGSLQAIVLCNIRPDVPLYPRRQRQLITRIREEIDWRGAGKDRFGVFTRWTWEPGPPRPRIVPVYVHAKVGLVDDMWATVGSANLDGLSLDSFRLAEFVGKENRAVEVNGVMFNGADGSNESAAVEILRRKLWAEHLGAFTTAGEPDINASVVTQRPQRGWLETWTKRAKANVRQLIEQPLASHRDFSRILPWPEDDSTHKTPRDHLLALGIPSHAVVPLKTTRAFDFETGDWKPKSRAKPDYP